MHANIFNSVLLNKFITSIFQPVQVINTVDSEAVDTDLMAFSEESVIN